MSKSIFGLVFLLLLGCDNKSSIQETTPTPSKDVGWKEGCGAVNTFAEALMEARQRGMSAEMANSKINALANDPQAKIRMNKMFKEAYTIPVAETEEEKNKAIIAFQDDQYKECLNGYLKGFQ